ncbi:MAG: hypothetical protein JO189_08440 [Deltaproteobacteria bacterium]|nr:hypothetical protein [Deltaproteobacteria bacterium]
MTLASGCGRTKLSQSASCNRASLRDLDNASWQKLTERKIYFGHQSVGSNIIDGIRDLKKTYPQLHLHIVHSGDPSEVEKPTFIESLVGRNRDPESKTADFLGALKRGMGVQGGVAMYKFCYVDMSRNTDVGKLFDEYRAAAALIKARYPRVVQVHITMPLTTAEAPVGAFAKRLLMRTTDRDLDLKRNQFNDLLRQEYTGREPIFDLATIESTRIDGSRTFFESGDKRVYSLAPEFTNDGGHLNELGRRIVAEQLLITLARL